MQTARIVPQFARGSYLMGPSRLGAFRHPKSFQSRPPHHHHDVLQHGHGTHIRIRARARAWRVARAPKSFPPPPRAHPARMERPNRACRRNRTITRQSSPWCASKRPRAPPRVWCNRKSCDFVTSRSAAATAIPMLWTVRVLVTRRAQQVMQPQAPPPSRWWPVARSPCGWPSQLTLPAIHLLWVLHRPVSTIVRPARRRRSACVKSKNPIRSTRSSPGAHTRWLGSRGAVVAFCCWSRLKCPGPAARVMVLPPAKRGATARPASRS